MAERSPCLSCDRLHQDKNDCVLGCAALDAYCGRAPKDERFEGEIIMARTVLHLSEKEAPQLNLPPASLESPAPEVPAASPVLKYCKHHPHREQHKKTGLCLECCQERGRRNAKHSNYTAMGQAAGATKGRKNLTLAALVDKLPLRGLRRRRIPDQMAGYLRRAAQAGEVI